MAVNSLRRLFWYFTLYQFTIGVLEAWDEGYEPSYLATENELPLTMVATSQSIGFIPWSVKFIFSYLTDSVNFCGWGHRRPYCAIGLAGTALCFCLLATFRPTNGLFAVYVLFMVLRNCSVALSDGATEGLSVDANIEEVSGSLQAWMMAGRMVGMALGSAVGGPITERGYGYCMVFLGLLTAAFIPINLFIKEERTVAVGKGYAAVADGGALAAADSSAAPLSDAIVVAPAAAAAGEGEPEKGGAPTEAAGDAGTATEGRVEKPPSQLAVLCASLRDRTMLALILFTFLSNFGTYVASFPIVPWLEERHEFTITEVGWLTFCAALGNMCVSVPMGYVFDWFKEKRIPLAIAALLAGGSYFLFLPAKGKAALFIAQFIIAGGTGALYTVQTSLIRICADERVGASTFGVVLGALNAAAFIGTFLGGPLSDGVSMEFCYIVGGACACLSVFIVPFINPRPVYTPPPAGSITGLAADASAGGVAGDVSGGLGMLREGGDDVADLHATILYPRLSAWARWAGVRPATARNIVEGPANALGAVRTALRGGVAGRGEAAGGVPLSNLRHHLTEADAATVAAELHLRPRVASGGVADGTANPLAASLGAGRRARGLSVERASSGAMALAVGMDAVRRARVASGGGGGGRRGASGGASLLAPPPPSADDDDDEADLGVGMLGWRPPSVPGSATADGAASGVARALA